MVGGADSSTSSTEKTNRICALLGNGDWPRELGNVNGKLNKMLHAHYICHLNPRLLTALFFIPSLRSSSRSAPEHYRFG